jgi:glycosyltransferase involved in cell wall biosynthesis
MHDGTKASPSPHVSSAWGEGRLQAPEQAAAPHPNPLPAEVRGEGIPAETRSQVTAIIPCLDEEEAIGPCVAAVLGQGVGEVIVVDGGSADRTAERAAAAGARVAVERRRGYGRALMSGIAALSPATSIVLFIDGDGSDRPEMIPAVLGPIESGGADFVMGSRLAGDREPGSLAPAQIVAGHLAGLLIRGLYGARFTDMSPFRAIRRDALEQLGMREATFGWNLEMQMRVAAADLRAVEIPVGQRRRVGGVSKVSGSVAAIRAAAVLVSTFLRLALGLRRSRRA